MKIHQPGKLQSDQLCISFNFIYITSITTQLQHADVLKIIYLGQKKCTMFTLFLTQLRSVVDSTQTQLNKYGELETRLG